MRWTRSSVRACNRVALLRQRLEHDPAVQPVRPCGVEPGGQFFRPGSGGWAASARNCHGGFAAAGNGARKSQPMPT